LVEKLSQGDWCADAEPPRVSPRPAPRIRDQIVEGNHAGLESRRIEIREIVSHHVDAVVCAAERECCRERL